MAESRDEVITAFRILGEAETVGAYRRVAGAVDLFGSRTTSLGRSQQEAGIAFGLSAAALAFFGRSALSAADDQVRLNRAVGDLKGSLSVGGLRTWAQGLEDSTGVAHDKIIDIAGILGTFQIPGGQAEELTRGILNATEALKALGITGTQTANQVGKAIQTGNAGPLRRAGIVIDLNQFKAATTETERVRLVLQALQAQGGDAAAVFRSSLPGAFGAFQSAGTTAMQGVGDALIGPERAIVELGISGLKTFNALPPAAKGAAGAIGVGLAGAVALYSGATLLALNNTVKLAGAHFQAAAAARAQAAAESTLAGSLHAAGASSAFAGVNLGAWSGAGVARVAGIGGAGAATGGMAAGGLWSRLAGVAGTTAGRVAGGASLAGLALGFLPDTGNRMADQGRDVLSGALTWGGVGGYLGTAIAPGPGTAIGAAVGAIGGGAAAYFGDEEKYRPQGGGMGSGGGADRTNQLLEEQNKILEAIRRDRALPTNEISGRDQVAGLFD